MVEDADVESDEFVGLLEARAGFYRMIASLMWNPLSQGQIDSMAQSDFSAFAEIGEGCADGANDMRRYLRKRNSGTRRELASDFTSVFGGTHSYEGRYATPYESLFSTEDGRFYAKSYRDVFRSYKAECLKLSDAKNYPDDHLSFMCEFLAFESERAARALREGDIATAKDKLRVSSDFLADHVLSWFDRYLDLAEKLVQTRFYRGVLKFVADWFQRDYEQVCEMEDALNACKATGAGKARD